MREMKKLMQWCRKVCVSNTEWYGSCPKLCFWWLYYVGILSDIAASAMEMLILIVVSEYSVAAGTVFQLFMCLKFVGFSSMSFAACCF